MLHVEVSPLRQLIQPLRQQVEAIARHVDVGQRRQRQQRLRQRCQVGALRNGQMLQLLQQRYAVGELLQRANIPQAEVRQLAQLRCEEGAVADVEGLNA